MKRRYLVALVVTALVCLALVWATRSPGRQAPAAVPKVALRAPPRPKLPTRTEQAPLPTRDEDAGAQGMGVVRCTVDAAWAASRADLGPVDGWQVLVAGPPSAEPKPGYVGAFPEVRVPPGDWRVTVVGADRVVTYFEVQVASGEVVPCTVGPRRVDVRVVDLEDEPVAGGVVSGCGTVGDLDDSGRVTLLVERSDCDLRVQRRDGALARFAVERLAMGDREVVLALDTRPVAGLGVPFQVGEAGVTVGEPMPGSPAEGAGLVEGDLLVEVDGTAVGGLAPYDFVNVATGLEGTTAELLVRGADGGTRTVRVVRARIPADDAP